MEELKFPNVQKPIWIMLSELYLEAELQDSDFQYMALAFFKSPFSFRKIKKMGQYEAFPVLFSNWLNPA